MWYLLSDDYSDNTTSTVQSDDSTIQSDDTSTNTVQTEDNDNDIAEEGILIVIIYNTISIYNSLPTIC